MVTESRSLLEIDDFNFYKYAIYLFIMLHKFYNFSHLYFITKSHMSKIEAGTGQKSLNRLTGQSLTG